MNRTIRNRLGRSKIEVTALGLGGAVFGNLYEPVCEESVRATIRAALTSGVRYFDTAPYYGYGLSEERLGRALQEADRDEIILSTKVGRLLAPRSGGAREDQGFIGANAFDPVFDYSYDGVMRSFESSLTRLNTDRIDILLMHDIGEMTHGPEAHRSGFEQAMTGGTRAMSELRASGAVGAIGLGVNECAVCLEAMDRCDFDCFLLAGRYTLLEQGAIDRLLPACTQRGISLVIGGPFNSGILVESPDDGKRNGAHYDYAAPDPAIVSRVERIRRSCTAHGVPLAAAALQFPLLHPAVACVIPGARSEAEMLCNAAWMDLDVPAELWSDLKEQGLMHPDATTESKL